MRLENHIEALLFLAGESLDIPRLCKILDKTPEEINKAAHNLEDELNERGIRLMKNGGKFTLGTSPESFKYCEILTKEELNKNIGKAGLETLAIILYKGAFSKKGVSRTEIDYIRGVNSTFTLRNLAVKGLIEKNIDLKDKRSFIYTPSMQLIQYLGITQEKDLPKFEEFINQINNAQKECADNN